MQVKHLLSFKKKKIDEKTVRPIGGRKPEVLFRTELSCPEPKLSLCLPSA